MSTTEGTAGGQGPGGSGSSGGSSTGPAKSAPPAGNTSSSGASSSDTRPIGTVGPGQSGSGGGAAGKTAERTPAPAPAPSKGGRPAPGTTAQAVPAKKAVPGKKAVPAKKAPPRPPAGRRVRLTVSRVDPWSVMKMSFLLSVAIGIAMVVMVFVLWSVLAGMGIFERINEIAADVLGADGSEAFDLMDYIGLARVMSLSIVVGVIDVILITAIATLGAFLYNVSAALVGGLQLTLTDD